MLLNYSELFKPYSGDGHSVERMISWLQKEASSRGIDPALVGVAVQRTMMDLAEGKAFSKTKCRCGCGIDKAATDLIHYTFGVMLSLDVAVKAEIGRVLEGNTNARLLAHIAAQNKAFTEEQVGTIWQRSPTVRLVKRLVGKAS